MARQAMAAFFRGVNVGGRRPVSMPRLTELFVSLGFADVSTYVQSGNVAFTTSQPKEKTRAAIEAACARELGLDTSVMLRTAAELGRVVARNPYGERAAAEPTKVHVVFLDGKPAASVVARLDPHRYAPDEWHLDGREVYVWYANGAGRSKLRLDLGIPGTARNWNTVTKMLALLTK